MCGAALALYFKDADWLQQVCRKHSDVGGSYPENEAYLSDISLGCMSHAAENFPDRFGIKVDDRFLKLSSDPLGR